MGSSRFSVLFSQHMCSLESELESQMGEFHVKMKGESLSALTSLPICAFLSQVLILFFYILDVSGLAGFARLCAGDQYEVEKTAQAPFRFLPAALSLTIFGRC